LEGLVLNMPRPRRRGADLAADEYYHE